MVLTRRGGAGGSARTPALGAERGSQSVEFALTIPFVVLVAALVLQLGVVAADVVTAQSVAFQAARVAAVDDDAAVRRAVAEAAGERPVEVEINPPGRRDIGQIVRADVRLRSAALEAFGMRVWLPASAATRVER